METPPEVAPSRIRPVAIAVLGNLRFDPQGLAAVRVLFVASSGERGGAELALLTYLEHLPPRLEGHGIVLSPGPVANLMADRLGRPVAMGRLIGRPSLPIVARFARWFASTLRRTRPDVVLATGIKPAVLCAPVCRALGVPLVWHKVDFSYDGGLARRVALLTTAVIPVSPLAGAAVPESRLLAPIPPPVRLSPSFRVSRDRPRATIGSVGRLVPYKGHGDVIKAAAQIPGATVLIAGGDDRSAPGHRQELRRMAGESRVTAEFLGHVDRMEEVYERITVLVQATYRDEHGMGLEAFGMAVAEACWAGLPIVATSGGASAYATRIVPERDPGRIAAAVNEIIANRASTAGGSSVEPRSRGTLNPEDDPSSRARIELAPERLAADLFNALHEVVWRKGAK